MSNKNMSLYAPNPKRDPVKGTGFADVAAANKTLQIIKNLSENHQLWIVTTMYNRARFHPHRTSDMLKAMEIFKKWLKDRLRKQSTKYKFVPRNKLKKLLENAPKLSTKQEKILSLYLDRTKIPIDLLIYRYKYINKNIRDPNKLIKVGYIPNS